MKRFYKTVAVTENDAGFVVTLDGKTLRSPGKHALNLPNPALAAAVAAEWDLQGEDIKPATMPLMTLACTAIDLPPEKRDAVAAEAVKYAGTDLLCYRAEAPESLVARERAAWQPLLDWAADRFDAPLRVTAGIVPIEQPADSLKALHAVLDGLDTMRLVAVADLTSVCGSLILALALWDGRLDAAGAFAAAELDESYQNERWGEDAEALVRRRRVEREIRAGAEFLRLLRA
jgi:chaperone required for assembly of F1-ATPase